MIHSPIGAIHTAAAAFALIVGIVVFRQSKSGKFHKRLGYVYVISMTIVIVTSFMIFRLTGTFNILHIAALFSTLAISKGLWHAFARRPSNTWFEKHLEMMTFSYLGLVAAFLAEAGTRLGMPYLHSIGVRSFWWFWALIAMVSLLVFLIGDRILKSHRIQLDRYKPKPRPDKL